MKEICSAFVALISMAILPSYAQERIAPGVTEETVEAIQSQLAASVGNSFWLTDVVNIDSAKTGQLAEGGITDPYGTLSGCYVFTSRQQQDDSITANGVVGVYKDGGIIWFSALGTIDASTLTSGLVTAVRDLNNDHKVEIITS